MRAELVAATLVRGIGFAALAALVGSLVVDLLVLPREAPGAEPVRRGLRRLGTVCLAVLVATTADELVTRARTMAGGDLAAAMTAMPSVLLRTHFGAIWLARFAALVLALLVCPAARRRARTVALLLALAVAATTSLTGHAADRGDLTLATGLDWVHVVATSTWTGGLLSLTVAVLGASRAWPSELLAAVVRRFSRMAGLCLLAAVATGSYNAWVELPGLSALWTTFYGRVLAVKLLLVAALAGAGAVNRYAVVPRLGPRRPAKLGERLFRAGKWVLSGSGRIARRELPSRLGRYVRREAVLALLVFAVTAVLVDSTPARHSGHADLGQMAEPTPVHVTMQALHESGGVPKGWRLEPPRGDAARGRDIFERLGCSGCHRRQGGEGPASAGAGPDLTGVGEHHPAGYILESILNPDAVIVEGPGYTGPDGRSIMPDYRSQLSVEELIDLVAYLRTL